MAKNGLLIGLALLERTEPLLKADKREQISRLNLESIRLNVTKALEYIAESGVNNIYVNGYLLSAVECMEVMLANTEFIETDLETKDIIVEKITVALENLYLEVGKYYTNQDFEYNMRLFPMLKRVVDECIRKGYYFGKTVGEDI